MTEQKRPGRPPKVKVVDSTEVFSHPSEIKVDGEPLTEAGLEAALEKVWADAAVPNPAQAYALRMWEGQSPDLSRHERLGRIAAALKEQGLSMEGVELP